MVRTRVRDGKHNTLNPSASDCEVFSANCFLDFSTAVPIVRSKGLFIDLYRLSIR